MKSARQFFFDGLPVESTSKAYTSSSEDKTVVDFASPSSTNSKSSRGFFENLFYVPAYCATLHWWWRLEFLRFEEFVCAHHWKVLSSIVVLSLFCFGLKAVTVDTNFDKLWIEESDRLTAEWKYLTKALQNVHTETLYGDLYYFSKDTKLSRMTYHSQRDEIDEKETDIFSLPSTMSKSKTETDSSLNSREYMGSMETILQTTIPYTSSQTFFEHIKSSNYIHSDNINDNSNVDNDNYVDILTPQALLDHMEFLIKVRRLTITVGSSKWSFKDLCQRVSLPFGVEMHHLQAYLDMIIPCIIITPLDCFWEGAKVLGPEEAMWVPWFDERTLLQWTNIDPVGLLQDLSKRYGNYSQTEIKNLINLFYDSGINHGYLNRSCLDPLDPACPVSAPNYRGKAPYISKILSGGCPGFASKMLHWPEEIIVGGRIHTNNSFDIPLYTNHQKVSFDLNQNKTRSSKSSDHFLLSSSVKFNKTSQGSKNLSYLIKANSLQSLILLRSPRDLYEAVRRNDPYKHEDWTLDDARHVLREWRRNLRRLIIEHNTGLQPNVGWRFFAFTSASLHDLLQEITLRLGPLTLIGCLLLVVLYGVVCLLGWRDPVRSQCWLALCGVMIIALSSVAGLGICAAVGIPFNVLTIQVLPFLLLGLGVDSIFVLTTCHECCIARRVVLLTNSSPPSDLSTSSSAFSLSSCSSKSSNPVHVLCVHGPSLLFGTISLAGAFFSAAFIPVPLIRQFCLQAGILIVVQSINVFMLFPVLLQLDATRRNQKRLDVLCCLRQPQLETTMMSNPPKLTTFCQSESCHLRPFNYYSGSKNLTPSRCHRHHHHHHHHHHNHHYHCRHCPYINSKKLPGGNRDISINLPETCISSGFSHPTIQVNVVNHLPRSKRSSSSSNFNNEVTKAIVKTTANSNANTVHTTVTLTGNQDKETNTTNNISESSGTENVSVLECGKNCPTCQEVTSIPEQESLQKCVNKSESYSESRTISSSLLVRFTRHFALFITSHWSIQLCICLLGLGLFCAAVVCATFKLRLGLDWSSLTPSDTIEYGFIKTAGQAFGLSNFHIIARGSDLPGSRPVSSQSLIQYTTSTASSGTSARSRVSLATVGRGIDFPMQQRRLRWMYDCLTGVSGVMLSGRKVWLDTMRDWLEEVQNAFDKDRKRGYIMDSGHWNANASELGILGLRLIVQTDRGPELSRINTGRIVRGGIVDPPAFYTLLRVWRSKDALNFSSLPCIIYPEPSIVHVGRLTGPGRPSDLHALSPAEPIEFVQTSFYAVGVSEMNSQLDLVQDSNYFFRLIVIVSFVCLFNAVCLIPTICYLIGPFHSRFILGRRNLSNITSTSHKSPIQQDDTNYPSHFSPAVNKTIHYLKCHPSGINFNSEQHHINMINDSQSSFSSSPSNMSPSLSSPSSSRSSSSFSHSEQNHNDESSQNMKISSKTESIYKESNCLTVKESPKDIVHHGLNYSNDHSTWMNRSTEQCSSNAAATAAAAAVVVAAAAAASVRSRPPSLSTISEEPSHSSSTVSLNHTTPPNSGNGSGCSSTGSSNNSNNSYLPNFENEDISLNSTACFNSVGSIKNYFTSQNLPLSLVTSVDLIRISRLLNPNISANEICESLCSSITSPASSNIHTSVKSHRTSKNRELVLDPNVACTLLAAVTATSYQTANKPVVEVTPVGQNENIPPPSYSSVVNQSHSIGRDRSSQRISVSSHQQKAYRGHDISTRVSDNEISVKSFADNFEISDPTTQLAANNIFQPNSHTTSSSSSSKTFKTNYHHLRKKNVSLVFSSPTHLHQTTPVNTSSNCKISQLPNTGPNSSTTHLNVNISHSCHNHKHCCSNCLITHCNSRSINDDYNSGSNHNANANIHHQGTSHIVLSDSNSDSQIKKSQNT
ncbi:unnamed protein product [Schistosoma intercalatum]|nr:unnamed protein product [Schistosoma intercalatum]